MHFILTNIVLYEILSFKGMQGIFLESLSRRNFFLPSSHAKWTGMFKSEIFLIHLDDID